MGVIVDSSVVIKAERRGDGEAHLLRQILAVTSEQQIGLTTVGVTELLHGIYRAESPRRSERRRVFLEQLIADLPVYDTLSKPQDWRHGSMRNSGPKAL